jgi:hypothetical protein
VVTHEAGLVINVQSLARGTPRPSMVRGAMYLLLCLLLYG